MYYSTHFLKWLKEQYPWAKWVATDGDGAVCIYNNEPVIRVIDSQLLTDAWVLRSAPAKSRKLRQVADSPWLSPVWKETKVEL